MSRTDANDPWMATGDESLLARCKQGDERAWALVHGHVTSLSRRACRGGAEAPEDICSGVMLKLVRGGIDQVRFPGAFKSYLRKVVLCAVIDVSRSPRSREVSLDAPRENREDARPVLVEIVDDGPSSEESVSRSDVRRIVVQVIKDLPGDCATLLHAYLRYKMGQIENYKELSATLGRPIGSISVQVRRCLARFREDPRAAALRLEAG